MSEGAGDEASPGTRLRLAREARGLSVEEAAQMLYVDSAKLRAIEADDLQALGAPVFARGHLRKYAALVGVPAEEVLAACTSGQGLAVEPSFVSVLDRPRRGLSLSRFAWPAGALALAVAVVAVLWWWGRPGPGAVVAAGGDTGVMAPAEAVPPEAAGAPPSEAQPPAAEWTLEVAVLRDCWVEVSDASGRQLVFELLPAGASRQLGGEPPLRVLLGDAAATRLAWRDGELAVPPAAVRRNVAHFEIGADGAITPLAAAGD